MTDDINDALGDGNGDGRESVARNFLSPEEVEERVAVFRASLVRLDQDPGEAARIDRLLAQTNAVFGSDFTLFDDPSAAGPARNEAQPEGRIVINGSHAQPTIEVDCAAHDSACPGFNLVINGDHAEPRIHVGASQPDQEVGHLAEEVEELRQEIASLRTRAKKRSGRKAPRRRVTGPPALTAVFGLAGAAIAFHSLAVVQVIGIIILGLVPALGLAIVTPAIWSGRPERREAAASVLGLLLNRPDPHQGVLRAGGAPAELALSGQEMEGGEPMSGGIFKV